MKLSFFGAAQTVTGSCHMLTTEGGRILIDCGMRQGEDAKGEYGEANFPFNPADIDMLLLTHAHIDHMGLAPLLVKRGFKGSILCTDATAQLATIMLPDCAHILSQEAEWQNRKNERAGKKLVEPLYDMEDVEATLKIFHGAEYEKRISLFPGVEARFTDVGHLLGSAAIELFVTENGTMNKVVFSGDVGRSDRPILQDPQDMDTADFLVLESTYGDREHQLASNAEKVAELASVFRAGLARGGNIVIPSFAIGRTQEMLFYIKKLLKEDRVPGLENVPVYIDSPLAINATKIYERCAEGYYDDEAMALSQDGSPFDFPTLRVAQTTDESKAINSDRNQKIIISSSGMCDAGRIRHHLKHNLYRADSTIVFAGYQAVGTLGRLLVDGASKVKLFGEDVRVNARIVVTDGFSGHADKSELIRWATGISPKPREVFLIHGEISALKSLSDSLTELGYSVTVPALGDEAVLVFETEAPHVKTPVRPLKKPAAKKAPAAEEAPATEEAPALPLSTTALEFEGSEQLKRIYAIIERSGERRSPDMELKRAILEADLKSVADKWDVIIN